MPSTYTPIASTTLTASASSISFTGIPATYTDLVLILRNSKNTGSTNNNLRLNNDNSALYASSQYYGAGSAPAFLNQANNTAALAGIAGNDAVTIAYIMGYSNTNMFKTILCRGANANTYITFDNSIYRSTNAINRVDWINVTFLAGTTCSLYGIKAA